MKIFGIALAVIVLLLVGSVVGYNRGWYASESYSKAHQPAPSPEAVQFNAVMSDPWVAAVPSKVGLYWGASPFKPGTKCIYFIYRGVSTQLGGELWVQGCDGYRSKLATFIKGNGSILWKAAPVNIPSGPDGD